MATEFQTGGGYAEARITLQTLASTISLDVADDLTGTPTGGRADFSIAAGDQAAFNAIAIGTRFILAISRPPIALPDASAPTVAIDAVADGDENTTVQLAATLGAGGDYDAIDYAWSVSGGTLDDAAAASPIVDAPGRNR